jgi:very-short-patch-repair endonuclease
MRNYVLDFYCAEFRLAIEIDGSVHDDAEQRRSDANRQAIIEEFGIWFIRVSTASVAGNVNNALRHIASEINQRR